MSRKARGGVEAVAACLDGGRTRLLIKDKPASEQVVDVKATVVEEEPLPIAA